MALKIPDRLETVADVKEFIIDFIKHYNRLHAEILGGGTLPLKQLGNVLQKIILEELASAIAGYLQELGTDRNLLDNPGFEGGSRSWKTGTGISFETTGGHNSNYYVKLTRSGANKPCIHLRLDGAQRPFEVNAGDVLYFGGSLKSSNGATVARIRLICVDKDKAEIAESLNDSVAMAWDYKSKFYTVPANGKFVFFQIWAVTADGSASFDNLVFKKVVRTGDLDDAAVTAAQIAPDAVEEAKIKSGAVTETKIGALAVATGKMQDGAVLAGKIGLDEALRKSSITTVQIEANSAKAISHSLGYPPECRVSMYSSGGQAVYSGLAPISNLDHYQAGWKITTIALGINPAHHETDGNMEVDNTNAWTALQSTLAKVLDPVHGGIRALKVTIGVGETIGYAYQDINVTPGGIVGWPGVYSYRGWLRNGNADDCRIYWYYFTDDWHLIDEPPIVTGTSEYVERTSLRQPVPGGTSKLRIQMWVRGVAGQYAYFDDLACTDVENSVVILQKGGVTKDFKVRVFLEQSGT